MKSSDYILDERREYAIYTLCQRAIPYAYDGLKHSGRRVLWTAKDGKEYKTATLAGATMPIHPHAAESMQGAINTLAAPNGNNIPLFDGIGAFGTLLNPTAYAAARYTSVKTSNFCKEVVFRDIEIIPERENYDESQLEPVHFLPLVPIVLLNPQEGIAVGFACDILPRTLYDIITSQISYLQKKKVEEVPPCFTPTNQRAIRKDEKTGKWIFVGGFVRDTTSILKIVSLPYGITHEKYIGILNALLDKGIIQDFDDYSKDKIIISIRFKRGELKKFTDQQIISLLKLEKSISENMNVIDFDGKRVWHATYIEMIERFSDWRLGFYKKRYEWLAANLELDIQRYRDILTAIRIKLGSVAPMCRSKDELKEYCKEYNIVHVDYIVDLPVYRFTEEEKKKIEEKLEDAEKLLAKYNKLIDSEHERKKVYVVELKKILQKFGDKT